MDRLDSRSWSAWAWDSHPDPRTSHPGLSGLVSRESNTGAAMGGPGVKLKNPDWATCLQLFTQFQLICSNL